MNLKLGPKVNTVSERHVYIAYNVFAEYLRESDMISSDLQEFSWTMGGCSKLSPHNNKIRFPTCPAYQNMTISFIYLAEDRAGEIYERCSKITLL